MPRGHRFPNLVHEDLRDFVRRQPCVIRRYHDCQTPPSLCAHLKTRGSGGADWNNTFPACWEAHAEQEGKTKAFEKKYKLNLERICRDVTRRFQERDDIDYAF